MSSSSGTSIKDRNKFDKYKSLLNGFINCGFIRHYIKWFKRRLLINFILITIVFQALLHRNSGSI